MAGRAHNKAAATVCLLLVILCLHGIGRGFLGGDAPVVRSTSSMVGTEPHHIGRTLLAAGSGAECRGVNAISGTKEKCDFVTKSVGCSSDGFFRYSNFVYCTLGHAVPAAMVVLTLWLLFCFVGLAVCADDFFCPSLVVISKTLRLSPNVAGVTFLAFGNGAPDFFSAIASLSKGKDPGLGIGGMFGAGIFVTTVVVGAISVIKPFKASERPLLRDTIFYMGAVYWVFYVLYRQKMFLWEAIGLVCLYVIYVITVVITSKIYSIQKEKAEAKAGSGVVLKKTSMMTMTTTGEAVIVAGTTNLAFENDTGKNEVGTGNTDMNEEPKNLKHLENGQRATLKERQISLTGASDLVEELPVVGLKLGDVTVTDKEKEEEARGEPEPLAPWWQQLLLGINPINIEDWPDMAWYGKAYEIFKSPIMFCINLTCPVVNYDDEVLNNWNKYLQCLQVLCAPVVSVFLVHAGFATISGGFKVWMLMLIIGAALSVLVFLTSKDDQKPKYHAAFGFFAFIVALIWIATLATEIVALLETFGVVINISNAILGLTLLAWGNSIGDLVSNVVMARQGFSRMGFAACFGAPLFNICLGFGIPLLIKITKEGGKAASLTITPVTFILCTSLLASLAFMLVMLPLLKFKVNRVFGVMLLVIYLIFLVVVILTETKILMKNWRP